MPMTSSVGPICFRRGWWLVRVARLALCLAAGSSAGSAAAQEPPPRAEREIVRNDFVTVSEVEWTVPAGRPASDRRDLVVVYLDHAAGEVAFQPRGSAGPVTPLPPVRAIVVELGEGPMRAYPNPTGHPPAFPRPGIRKPLENDRVVVWDYSFTSNSPTPMHFHERDVVVVFLGDGTLASTTPAGVVTTRDHTDGLTLFNPGNRLHTETLTRGRGRVIVVELK